MHYTWPRQACEGGKAGTTKLSHVAARRSLPSGNPAASRAGPAVSHKRPFTRVTFPAQVALSLRALDDESARNALCPGQTAWAAAAKLRGKLQVLASQAGDAGFADSAARRYSALMRWASSSWSSRMTMRQAASMGVP